MEGQMDEAKRRREHAKRMQIALQLNSVADGTGSSEGSAFAAFAQVVLRLTETYDEVERTAQAMCDMASARPGTDAPGLSRAARDDAMAAVKDLREPLTMSMFAIESNLIEEQRARMMTAADVIERMLREAK